MHNGQPVVLLKVQGTELMVPGNNPNDLNTRCPVFFCDLADTASLLLAAASPAPSEFQKHGHAGIVLG